MPETLRNQQQIVSVYIMKWIILAISLIFFASSSLAANHVLAEYGQCMEDEYSGKKNYRLFDHEQRAIAYSFDL